MTVGILTFSVGASPSLSLAVARRLPHPNPPDVSLVSPLISRATNRSGSSSSSSSSRRIRRSSAAAEAFRGCCVGSLTEETPSLLGPPPEGPSSGGGGPPGGPYGGPYGGPRQAPYRRLKEHEAQVSLSVTPSDAVAACRWISVFLMPRAVVTIKPQVSLRRGVSAKVEERDTLLLVVATLLSPSS